MKLIMCKGLPASGKTTWAKEQVKTYGQTIRINKDDIRAMMHADVWNRRKEKETIQARDALIKTFLPTHDVIVDDTNLAPIHEAHLKNITTECNAQFTIKDFTDVPLEECIKRDKGRWKYVGEKVIKDMYYKYLYKPTSPIQHSSDLENCIIVDLDGTLADNSHRSPFAWDKVLEDKPREVVINTISSFAEFNKLHVIILSGRDSVCRENTEKWLKKYNIYYNALHMRPQGDMRKDAIVKEEIYCKEIEGKYNVRAIFDDRPQVIRMWQSIGFADRIFNVGTGEEF